MRAPVYRPYRRGGVGPGSNPFAWIGVTFLVLALVGVVVWAFTVQSRAEKTDGGSAPGGRQGVGGESPLR